MKEVYSTKKCATKGRIKKSRNIQVEKRREQKR